MDFLSLMQALSKIQETFPDMEWNCKGGILTVQTYVGMENMDLLNQGREMFSPR